MEDSEYRVIFKPLSDEDGGGYLAYVPDLPGCVSDGETEAEAFANLYDAVAAWIERAREMGRPIPPATPESSASSAESEYVET